MSHQQLRIYLDQIHQTIEKASSDLDAGNMVDLTYCDSMVHKFCDVLQTLPVEDARQYQQSLKRIDEDLRALAENMTLKRDDIKQQILQANAMNQAGNAYEQATKHRK